VFGYAIAVGPVASKRDGAHWASVALKAVPGVTNRNAFAGVTPSESVRYPGFPERFQRPYRNDGPSLRSATGTAAPPVPVW